LAAFHACQGSASREWTRGKSGGKHWQTTSLCALPGKRQWFIVVTKGRSRPDGTYHCMKISKKIFWHSVIILHPMLKFKPSHNFVINEKRNVWLSNLSDQKKKKKPLVTDKKRSVTITISFFLFLLSRHS